MQTKAADEPLGADGVLVVRGTVNGCFRALVKFLSSLKFTVVILVCAVVVVFWGTIAQVDIGLYAAQQKFFRSWFITVVLPGTGFGLPVFPGGYLVGTAFALNVVLSLLQKRRVTKENVGFWLTHAGLFLLLVGQFATDMLSVESVMRLVEGQAQWYSEDQRRAELAIVETTRPDHDLVVAIPPSLLGRTDEIEIPGFPFKVKPQRYMQNSEPIEDHDEPSELAFNHRSDKQIRFRSLPREHKSDRRDMPTASVELISPEGSLGTWVASFWLARPHMFTISNRTFELSLRPVRYYRPFALELLKFKHEKHPGSAIPRNFESEVRIINPAKGENRLARIRMNNPLRYQGETFYQSGYDEHDPRVSILQVVRNPAWVTPYVSCALITLGLIQRFGMRLLAFVSGLRK